LNNTLWGICGYGKLIARTVDELLVMVKSA
jgi:hypothetical protein